MKVEYKNVCFSYHTDKEVIKKLNLTINSGEVVAVIGHNGSGKSTLAKLTMGLLPLTSGSIYIDDIELNEKNVDMLRQKMGMIFQNPDNQFVGVTVKDDIAFGLENRCVPVDEMESKMAKYISLVDMVGFEDKNPEELSGGQKQRVAIAGALAMEPDLLIFDESTSMLDPKGTKEVGELIKKIKEEKDRTIIIITHNLNEATFADRVVLLNDGVIKLDGTPQEVFKQVELLQASGLKTIDSVTLVNDLKNKNYNNKKAIEDALWELTFKM